MRSLLILAIVALLASGCIRPTEDEKQTARASHDLAAYVSLQLEADEFAVLKPYLEQLVKNTGTISEILGAPEEPLDIQDLPAVEEARQAAEDTARARVGWVGWAVGGLVAVEAGLRIFGLGGIAGFVGRARKKLEGDTEEENTS